MGGRRAALASATVLATVVGLPASALAANQTVTAESPPAAPTDRFRPASVTVNQGETVTWNNASGQHDVHFDDNSFLQPPDLTQWDTRWTVSRTFNAVGSFRYYCDVHGGPGGTGMSGTVVVNAAPPGTPLPPGAPPPNPTPTPKLPLSADSVAPKLVLAGAKSQRVLKQRGVTVRVKSNEASTLTARGSVTVPNASKVLKFKSVTAKLTAGAERKVKLGLSRKALRTLRRPLRRGTRLVAKISLSAKDGNGNVKTGSRTIRLKA